MGSWHREPEKKVIKSLLNFKKPRLRYGGESFENLHDRYSTYFMVSATSRHHTFIRWWEWGGDRSDKMEPEFEKTRMEPES